MRIALSSFSLPEPSANALPTAQHSFKSALTSAERRIGQQAATPDPSTPDPSTLFASTVAPNNASVPQSNARLPTDATAAPPDSSLTDLEAHEPTQGGEKRVATSPVGAARGVDPGMHRIERPDQARPSVPPSLQIIWPRASMSAEHDLAWTFAQAECVADDRQRPLGFAEPGVIRPLRAEFGRLDLVAQGRSSAEARTAPPLASNYEHHRREELSAPTDRLNHRTPPAKTATSTVSAQNVHDVRSAFLRARPTGAFAAVRAAPISTPTRSSEEHLTPIREPSSKARLPPPTTSKPAPSLIFREAAGALDIIIAFPGATPELRARLQRALEAIAVDYGLQVARMTLNGVAIERAKGPKGG